MPREDIISHYEEEVSIQLRGSLLAVVERLQIGALLFAVITHVGKNNGNSGKIDVLSSSGVGAYMKKPLRSSKLWTQQKPIVEIGRVSVRYVACMSPPCQSKTCRGYKIHVNSQM